MFTCMISQSFPKNSISCLELLSKVMNNLPFTNRNLSENIGLKEQHNDNLTVAIKTLLKLNL